MPDDNKDGLTDEEFEEAYKAGKKFGEEVTENLADTILGKDTKPEDVKERKNFIKSIIKFATKVVIHGAATDKKAEKFEERLKNEREDELDEKTR